MDFAQLIQSFPAINISQGGFILYFIECVTENHYYVGISSNIGSRIHKHTQGHGSPFIKKHGIKRVLLLDSFPNRIQAERAEDELTLSIEQAGYKVRGGNFNEQNRRGTSGL